MSYTNPANELKKLSEAYLVYFLDFTIRLDVSNDEIALTYV